MNKTHLVYTLAGVLLAMPLAFADNGGNFSGGQSSGPAAAASAPATDPESRDQPQDHGWRGRHGHRGGFFQKLNLTDDQKKQLKDNWQKQRESMKSSFEQIKTSRKALRDELAKPNPDMNTVNALQTQLKAAQGQMADNRLNSLLAVKKVLNPDQFSRFLNMQEHMKTRMMHKRHHRSMRSRCQDDNY